MAWLYRLLYENTDIVSKIRTWTLLSTHSMVGTTTHSLILSKSLHNFNYDHQKWLRSKSDKAEPGATKFKLTIFRNCDSC